MKLRPLQDRVLIRLVVPEAKTSGGIFIPDTAQEKPVEGEVVAVGSGARDESGRLLPKTSSSEPMPASVCCAASIPSPMPSG
jgi:co-chaperonin GroES (HSP10)